MEPYLQKFLPVWPEFSLDILDVGTILVSNTICSKKSFMSNFLGELCWQKW
jgi:hypothetical protein